MCVAATITAMHVLPLRVDNNLEGGGGGIECEGAGRGCEGVGGRGCERGGERGCEEGGGRGCEGE